MRERHAAAVPRTVYHYAWSEGGGSAIKIEFKRLTEVAPGDIIALTNHPLVRRQMPLTGDDFDEAELKKAAGASNPLYALSMDLARTIVEEDLRSVGAAIMSKRWALNPSRSHRSW